MTELHKLAKRQLKRFGIDDSLKTEHQDYFAAVSEAYVGYEQDVSTLERSLFLISEELNERNALLKNQLGELSETKNQLQSSLSVLNATFDATGENIVVYDVDGNVMSINCMGQTFFLQNGVTEYQRWSALLSLFKYPNQAVQVKQKLEEDPTRHINGVIELSSNRFFEYRSLPQIADGKLIGRVWCFRDITQQKESEDLIQHQAYHDALTGLPNRNLLLDRVEHALALAKRSEQLLAVLFIDLDNFKRVNDTEGHKAGDELLIELVQRVKSRLREQDTLARLGGDEFVLLLESVASKQDIRALCEELLAILTEPFCLSGRQHFVSCSIGVACFPQDDNSAEHLILKADMAMYQAKAQGKNNYQFYDQSLEQQAMLQVKVERELREALQADELEPYFQPKIDLSTGEIIGAEILMRWFKPDGSSVPPDIFIPVAETTGLISQVGKKAIDSAFECISQWQSQGLSHLKLAINLSIIEFQDAELIRYLLSKCDESNECGSQLIIELTESIFMENKEVISRTMEQLRTRGIAFALDDFGKGYSSFSYLQILPIDYLKIDKAFLQGVTTNKQSAAITRTIIDIGHNLELSVIAEGVEDQATLDYVMRERCQSAQGYFLYKPMPRNDFNTLINQECQQSAAGSQ
ncbi:putative bifunctional diguanylate cyclase/phosphodiesterase [Thalassotalea euphylliae]|uniref:EAL domain-containing protein n=1 Tax=Thalassotalea euphylliae TaxID=1655234 RepID=A0A3E0U222_9GAMM|nr:EAL domain-containing protein [Thalassotalea euphylliae]REL30764.1 EAL domain-containing protein [Thalassotalea euphylliae]